MLIFLGLPFGVALATHKVASVALGLGATLRHLKESHLERRFSLIILGAGLPGVVLGALTILQIPERAATLVAGFSDAWVWGCIRCSSPGSAWNTRRKTGRARR